MLSNKIASYVRTKLKADSGGISDIVELNGGKSGAPVYRAKVISTCSNMSGVYIIKLVDTNGKWFSASDNEEQKCKELHSRAKEFRSCLVELIASEEVDGYIVLLYRQANDSILNSDTLDRLKLEGKGAYLKEISYDLLSKMNADFRQDGRAADFFPDTLTYRLEDGGNFYCAAEEILEKPMAPAFLAGDRVYPNPVYYIKNQSEWLPHCKDKVLIRGNVHGDLHGENIICMKDITRPKDMQYSIIDYDSYNSNGYLLFDHAYLELYLYYKLFLNNDCDQWREDLEPLLWESFYTELPVEIGDFSAYCSAYCHNMVCEGVKRWQEESLPHMRDDVDIQFRLAQIAAGANFFSKRGITDHRTRTKFLIYMGLCFCALFDKISFSWPSERPSMLKSAAGSNADCKDELWKKCLRYAASYTPVLLTDDNCPIQDDRQLAGLSLIDWRLVIDIGKNIVPDDITTRLAAQLSPRRHVNIHTAGGSIGANDCEWIICKKESGTYLSLWLNHQKEIKKMWQAIRSANRMKPYLFVFDIKEGKPFAEQFLTSLMSNIQQLAGSRFVSLQELFNQEHIASLEEFYCACVNCRAASLLDLSAAAQDYFSAESGTGRSYVTLPHLESMQEPVLTEKELAYYRTSIELVYSGIENNDSDCDFGASFYRGNEIKWRDISNQCDLPLIEGYEAKIQELKSGLIDSSFRIRRLKLVHGAGTGGTTLSKRILWDLKETTPVMRLLHYTESTANILLEIYRKTGKTLFLSVEMGSTVINQDDLDTLISAVSSENGKLWVLQVERSHGKDDEADKGEEETAFIELQDTMKQPIAKRFFDKFRQMTPDQQRHDYLNHITNLTGDIWLSQRCPFFYGFYTFQEEYNLENIQQAVAACKDEVKNLLSDMALMTVYSQNIGIPIYEAAWRISGSYEFPAVPTLILNQMDSKVAKIIVCRENGMRICHKIIAENILDSIYDGADRGDRISAAAFGLIDRMYSYYGDEDDYVDTLLRELFIDRAVVYNERMKFSFLIGDIEKSTQKEAIFQKLISYYPSNPHYLNHMARLLVAKEAADYATAVDLIDKAVDISDNDSRKIHYITKGCILTKKAFSRIDSIRDNTRRGLYAMGFEAIVQDIQRDYSAAEGAFLNAQETGLKDSYTFFPYIDLECRIVEKLASCDKGGRSRQQLLKQDDFFYNYYMEHYGKAVELFDQMRAHCWDNAEDMLKSARRHLDAISLDESELVEKLSGWNKVEGRQAQFARRTYSAALYAHNGYSWENLDQGSLDEIARAMYTNISHNLSGVVFQDTNFWFEAYCRLKTFAAEHAVDVIQDYMPEGYNKEFNLFILQFLRLEQGFATAQEVVRHLKACKDSTPIGVNTSKPRMAYAESAVGCPIISMNYVRRGKHGEITGLKQFQGVITNIRGSTSAIVQVNKLGLEAVFVPSIQTEDGQKREFTSKNLLDPVKFNLLFSYSGLRAWNIEPM